MIDPAATRAAPRVARVAPVLLVTLGCLNPAPRSPAPAETCVPEPLPTTPAPDPFCARLNGGASTPQRLCLGTPDGGAWAVVLDREDSPVVAHSDARGRVVERTALRNLKASYPWQLEPPFTLFDFDGDGSPELWVRRGAARDGRSLLVTFRDGRIDDYPTPAGPFDELRDVDGDGRPDGIRCRTFTAMVSCTDRPRELVARAVDRSLPDGTFAPTAPVTAPYDQAACASSGEGPLLRSGDAEMDPRRVFCARVLGGSHSATMARVVQECRPHLGDGCAGPCGEVDLLLQIAQDRFFLRDRGAPEEVRIGPPDPPGRLDPDVIQRVVRESYGRFRLCYEHGLGGSANLEGRVVLRFRIGPDGQVRTVDTSDSDIADGAVRDCVARWTYLLDFPAPTGGAVDVVYPIRFAPG